MKNLFSVLLLLSLLAGVTACAAPAAGDGELSVLATTTFLADIAQNVAGARVQVQSLLPYGADAHVYQPTPRDAAKTENAGLLILNGAAFEHFIEPLLESLPPGKLIIEAAEGIAPRASRSNEHGIDPHMWLDPNLVILYVENIRAALTEYDPAGAKVYQSNAQAYVEDLQALDAWIKSEVGKVPAQARLLVMSHQSLGYFAERYQFRVAGAVIPSFSSDAAPSARQMAELTDVIQALGVKAIFLEAADNDTLAKQIAAETGVKVVYDLQLGSLTDGAPAATYIDMMKYNVTRIVEALR